MCAETGDDIYELFRGLVIEHVWRLLDYGPPGFPVVQLIREGLLLKYENDPVDVGGEAQAQTGLDTLRPLECCKKVAFCGRSDDYARHSAVP